MSGTPDPLKDWLVATWRDTFGDQGPARGTQGAARGIQVGADGQPTRVTRFFPFSPIVCGAAAVGFYAPRIASAAAGNDTVVDALTQLHDYSWPLAAAAVPLVAVDVSRHRTRK